MKQDNSLLLSCFMDKLKNAFHLLVVINLQVKK